MTSLSASLRRKVLDIMLVSVSDFFTPNSVVLDIGGRDRGCFEKPRNKVKKWIFADIEPKHNPDIVLDVSDMKVVKNLTIDIIVATELFEHVSEPELGLKECFRVLRKGGHMILSAPFLYRVHGDPYDFQRWTDTKWKKELTETGFEIERLEVMGRYFSTVADGWKFFASTLPKIIRYPLYLCLWYVDRVAEKLDKTQAVINSPMLGSFHGGYFIVVKK
jgi:SAM-dependent methyltransferase